MESSGLARDTGRAMSEENVEIVRAAIDGFNGVGDWESALKRLAPNFEFDMSRALGPWRGVYGRDEFERVVGEFNDGWESARIEPQEFIEVGDHVVAPLILHLVGRDGIGGQARTIWAWTIRDGTVERVCLYQERDEALSGVERSE
jgi:ketosteroid isomerase-like protein